MGVWIEMGVMVPTSGMFSVTPFVGVWIEILLKAGKEQGAVVTPFVGVWIEIRRNFVLPSSQSCHSLRGSVD